MHKSRKFSFWIQGIKLPNRENNRFVEATLEIGSPAVPYLIKEIRSQDSSLIRSSLYSKLWKSLPNWARNRVHPPTSGAGTIPALAYTLGCLGHEARDAIPTLVRLLDDRERSVRYYAVWALGQIGATEVRSAISQLLRDNDTSPTLATGGGAGLQVSRNQVRLPKGLPYISNSRFAFSRGGGCSGQFKFNCASSIFCSASGCV